MNKYLIGSLVLCSVALVGCVAEVEPIDPEYGQEVILDPDDSVTDQDPGDVPIASVLDLTNDFSNCGATGYACVGGRSCVSSRCSPAWVSLPTTGQPSARAGGVATTISNKYVIGGGCTATGTVTPTATSKAFDPSNGT